MTWETVIGLETHVELATQSKIFCSCPTAFGAPPNTQCCPVCTGVPDARPVLNKETVDLALRAGLAFHGQIASQCIFDRKHYSYPDLPKGYQITQFRAPIMENGTLSIQTPDGTEKVIRIRELHLEEDAGKLIRHPQTGDIICDHNRCGIPLIEIVTCADFSSADEVIAYLEKLRLTLQYLDVSDCKIQEGSLRCDVNLSVRPAGSKQFGVRTEMKNLGSFRAIRLAIAYESKRQIAVLEQGGEILQETRRWDEELECSVPMRLKETAADYRYIPEPDLPPLPISGEMLAHAKQSIPELVEDKIARYQKDWALPLYDCQMLTSQKALAAFFEETVALGAPPKQAANWIMGEVLHQLSALHMDAASMPLSPATLARIIHLVSDGTLNRNTAVKVFEAVFSDDLDVDAYIQEHGLLQVSDTALLDEVVSRVLAANPKSVADYRSGKEKAFGFLVGQVMRELRSQAAPRLVHEILKSKLS